MARPRPDALREARGTSPFGTAPVRVLPPGERLPDDADEARAFLAEVAASGRGVLALSPGVPTAAFSRRDTLLPGYEAAARAVAAHGYPPVVRPVGGHLALYDAHSLVLHLAAPHPEPRETITARFEQAGDAFASALRGWGVDARVGAVPGEYCAGVSSVNAAGRRKLIGTGQRLIRGAYLFSAVIMLRVVPALREGLTEAYAHLGLDFDPATVGAVTDEIGPLDDDAVRAGVLQSLEPLVAWEQPDTPRSHNFLQ